VRVPAGIHSDAGPTEERPVSSRAFHVCLDMQNLISPSGPWAARWAERVLPAVVSLIEHAPRRTIFTRFIPPADVPGQPGGWQDFYEKWTGLTLSRIDPTLLELLPPLRLFIPPAIVFDKGGFSAFSAPGLLEKLKALKADTLVLSGAESDMCVLATALAGLDLGYRIVVATDAICSASDSCHDAVQRLYNERFSAQVRTLAVEEIRSLWSPAD
jgi:nicotinamidase-related amidase